MWRIKRWLREWTLGTQAGEKVEMDSRLLCIYIYLNICPVLTQHTSGGFFYASEANRWGCRLSRSCPSHLLHVQWLPLRHQPRRWGEKLRTAAEWTISILYSVRIWGNSEVLVVVNDAFFTNYATKQAELRFEATWQTKLGVTPLRLKWCDADL